ncbi:MAG TPA: hypothetical protein VNN22_17380 [Verrucomicrobiae bacterium]|nr:hypothetical protein [Verrucomicrobiae bacterium]
MKHISLELEKLEQRIAPGGVTIPPPGSCTGGSGGTHATGKSHKSNKTAKSEKSHKSGGTKAGSKCA